MPRTQVALETKTFKFEVKSFDETQGIIKGYLAVFSNIDSEKDRIRPGAFKKSISEGLERKTNKGRKFLWPLLWMHEPEKPIGGVMDALEDKVGLLITAQLDISTNEAGIPLNPLAMSTYSGLKMGYIDELSVGYKALQKSYSQGGIRDLTEMQVFESSAVTMNFAANDQALVSQVKSMNLLETKSDFPLADKATPWSKSKAIKDIEKATGGDWSKASKYFFWSASNPTTEADHKFPFVANVGGSMKAVPRAIFNAAARLESAKGVDTASIKSKIAGYYRKLGMTPPWENGGKSYMPDELETKDFHDRYREEQIKDWKSSDFANLAVALQSAIMDIFAIGDEPQVDVLDTILNGVDNGSDDPGNKVGFIDAVKDYVQKGIDLDVSNYLTTNPYFSSVYGSSSYGYMTRSGNLETKKGATVSKDSAARLGNHVDTLALVTKAITTVAEDMALYITGGPAFADDGNNDPDNTAPNKDTSVKTATHRPLNAPNNDQPIDTGADEFTAELAAFLAQELINKAA